MRDYVVTVCWHQSSSGRGTVPMFVPSVKNREEAVDKALKNAHTAMSIPTGSTLMVQKVVLA